MRIIAHIDMDAFFASVEERYTPRFKGLPIAVGAEPKNGKGRGVVSTANYKAREYGIHSAMPITEAWRISEEIKKKGKPEVIFLPVDFELYNKSSANILRIIQKYFPPERDPAKGGTVERASIDEFYFDLSFAKNFKKAETICKKMKQEIKKEENITCSIGIGPNKLIAKIAAGAKKPDGLFIVRHSEAEKFLENMAIRKIPGIGPKTEIILKKFKAETVKDLKKISKQELKNILGKYGEDLYFKIRGIDNSPIVINREVKSIGEQATFEKDTLEALYIGDELSKMCENVFCRFKADGFEKCRTIAITVRFTGFETRTSAKTISARGGSAFGGKNGLGESDLNKFKTEALKLMLPYLDKRKNPKLKPIRLIGIRMENFGEEPPKSRQGKLLP